MSRVVALLSYEKEGLGPEIERVTIGQTSDVGVLRALRGALLEEAERHAAMWEGTDATLAEMAAADAERLERILDVVLPPGDGSGGLQLVPPDT